MLPIHPLFLMACAPWVFYFVCKESVNTLEPEAVKLIISKIFQGCGRWGDELEAHKTKCVD